MQLSLKVSLGLDRVGGGGGGGGRGGGGGVEGGDGFGEVSLV